MNHRLADKSACGPSFATFWISEDFPALQANPLCPIDQRVSLISFPGSHGECFARNIRGKHRYALRAPSKLLRASNPALRLCPSRPTTFASDRDVTRFTLS